MIRMVCGTRFFEVVGPLAFRGLNQLRASMRLRVFGALLAICAGMAGCATGPLSFRAIDHKSPIYRARAAMMGERLPDRKVAPRLIEHLSDPDALVRMTAHEELQRRSGGLDFGFVPWTPPENQATAIAKWKEWWESQPEALAKPKLLQRTKPSETP